MRSVEKRILFKLLFIIALIISLNSVAMAQSDPGDPGDGDHENIPLDPGSWVLVAAGVGYGVKKWKDTKAQNKIKSIEEKDINQKL